MRPSRIFCMADELVGWAVSVTEHCLCTTARRLYGSVEFIASTCFSSIARSILQKYYCSKHRYFYEATSLHRFH